MVTAPSPSASEGDASVQVWLGAKSPQPAMVPAPKPSAVTSKPARPSRSPILRRVCDSGVAMMLVNCLKRPFLPMSTSISLSRWD